MGTRVMAFVAAMGATAAGVVPVEAQIGDAARTGRASGQIQAPGRYDRDCREWNRRHGWEDGWRIRECEEGHATGWVRGDRNDRRYDRRDARFNSRFDRRERWYRGDREHRLLMHRLDRLHDDWHHRYGWTLRSRRGLREHAALHRHLDRLHDDWHRHDRRWHD